MELLKNIIKLKVIFNRDNYNIIRAIVIAIAFNENDAIE